MALKDEILALAGGLRDFDLAQLADINSAGSWPLAVKLLVWLLVLAAVLLAGSQTLVSNRMSELERAQALEAQLRSDHEQKRIEADGLEAYQLQQQQLELTFETLLRQLPSDTEIPGLIEDMTLAGLNNGLVIENIDLAPEVKREFHVEKPVQIIVAGGYHQLGAFVSDLAALPRIVTLHDFTIETIGGQGSTTEKLRMEVLAKTYRYDARESGRAFGNSGSNSGGNSGSNSKEATK